MTTQPTCKRGCRLVPLLPELWLCDHSAYGRMVDLKGAVTEGRRMLAAAGGYEVLRRQLDEDAAKRKQARKDAHAEGVERVSRKVREG